MLFNTDLHTEDDFMFIIYIEITLKLRILRNFLLSVRNIFSTR